MSNGFLTQEEIDSLLNGPSTPAESTTGNTEEGITDIDKDLLGEIGNISMGSASTALSQIINQSVNITTPVVSTTTLGELKEQFHIPNIVLEVEYTSGILGKNILIMQINDAAVIANLMMGGDGTVSTTELSEIELSAVQEAMNQMIGSAATSMATMFAREVNISPPISKTWDEENEPVSEGIGEDDPLVKVSFKLTIGDLVDSNIMQLLPLKTAKKIVSIMMGEEQQAEPANEQPKVQERAPQQEVRVASNPEPSNTYHAQESHNDYNHFVQEKPIYQEQRTPVEVHQASFDNLTSSPSGPAHKNIDLILDVPLEISVVLGRTKKSIKDILSLSNGSLIELDKVADEPVEILVNGKRVAFGEVVVVDENFGVRITSIVSNAERIKSLR
ncbi:flagellar motor switch phosphatase FliY [Clostridium manihotivorum]|uniref:Flagellar motor switch phosphatase FliY n=1 Tax=Clostridium manihotivorum TaxID=2320868 RepID=A0A410DRF8_9CLOT|nr:flagellar motor switch phosphatase FliY [Clostridium manihotivorum]QAA31637.1 flagellar motor switch phosphatase FliY [Clostridium manihotivorum]